MYMITNLWYNIKHFFKKRRIEKLMNLRRPNVYHFGTGIARNHYKLPFGDVKVALLIGTAAIRYNQKQTAF